jgi:hypothetical protein
MKKLLLPFLLLSGATLFAQPTITQAQFALTVGDVITSYPQTYSVPSTGASQTWNYTAFTTSSPSNSTIINPASSTIAGLPTSTLCYDYGSSTNDCYLVNATGFFRTGVGNATASIPYNVSTEQLLSFPVTYNTSNLDFFRANYTASGNPAHRSGFDSTTVVGWGTLNLPASVSISNAMLVKTHEVYKDSVCFSMCSFWVVGDYDVTTYNFYAAGYHGPIVTMSKIVSNIIPSSQSGTYNIANLTAGIESIDISHNFNVYPNPVDENFTLGQKGNIDISGLDYSIVNINGQVVQTGIVNGDNLNFNVEGLASGLYVLNINSNDFRVSKRFIKN